MKASQQTLRTLLAHFFKKYRTPVIIGIVSIILVDSAELILPFLLKRLIDAGMAGAAFGPIRRTMLELSGLLVFLVGGRYLWRATLAKAAMRAGADLREQFSKQIFEVYFAFFDRKKVGDLMTLATSDVENMRTALGPGLISIVDSCFYCTTIPIVMSFLAPKLALKMLIPVIGIPFGVLILQRKIGFLSKQVQDQIGRLGSQTQEMVAGVRLAKIYGIEGRLHAKLSQESAQLNSSQVRLAKIQSAFGPTLEFFLSFSLVILFGAGGAYSVGTLVAMQRYLQKLMWPMSAIGLGIIYFQKAKSSGIEFYQFLEEKRTEILSPERSSPPSFIQKEGIPLIEARNLTYQVIQNFSFKVFPGEWVGIEGKVATGKSTLFSLLLKFYELPPGQLFVNGKDIAGWDAKELRHFFASVLQDPYLFQGSVKSNLEVGDDLELFEAMETAHVHGAVLDHRMEEVLGEKGAGLSGGQKQRIAIARALRKSAPVLLLDDPLSSVDFNTAKKVLEKLSLSLKKRKKTVLFISHHAEHLEFCDRVIRL